MSPDNPAKTGAVRLMTFRHVPVDEQEEIAQLLTDHGIEHYTTPEGRWGLSAAALWLRNREQLATAKALNQRYQQERAIKAQREYEQLKQSGDAETFFQRLRREPLRMVFYIAAVAAIIYLSISPFLALGD